MSPIRAIIFDIGGVIFRAGDFRLSDKWVAQCSLEAEAFDQAVLYTELDPFKAELEALLASN